MFTPVGNGWPRKFWTNGEGRIPSGRAFFEQLEALRRPTCIIPSSDRARWTKPRIFCIVRCHGWRPSGGWRDPVVVRFEDMAI